MPIYEYQCPHCERRFEVLQRMGAGAEGLLCPSCGGRDVKRMLSTFAAGSGSSGSAGAACGPGGFT